MHEMSLVEAMMGQVLKVAQEHQLKTIDEVEVRVGVLRQVVPEILEEAFGFTTEGTIAKGAKLKVVEVRASVRCNICGKVFDPKLDNFLCPDCQKADAKVLTGEEFEIVSVSGDK